MTEEQEVYFRREMRKSFIDPSYSIVVPFEVSDEDCLRICIELDREIECCKLS